MRPEDLPTKKKLIQLAEEASELAQASLKMIRAMDGDTPMFDCTAWGHIREEIADVEVCSHVLMTDDEDKEKIVDIFCKKYQRWSERLNGCSEVSEVHTE